MNVNSEIKGKTSEERSLALRKQKLTSDFLRQLAESEDSSSQVQLPEDSGWRMLDQDQSEILGLEDGDQRSFAVLSPYRGDFIVS